MHIIVVSQLKRLAESTVIKKSVGWPAVAVPPPRCNLGQFVHALPVNEMRRLDRLIAVIAVG